MLLYRYLFWPSYCAFEFTWEHLLASELVIALTFQCKDPHLSPGDPITLLKYFISVEPILYVIPIAESYRTDDSAPRRLCSSRPSLYHRSNDLVSFSAVACEVLLPEPMPKLSSLDS